MTEATDTVEEQTEEATSNGVTRIVASSKLSGEKVSTSIDLKASLQEAVEAFGEETVYYYFHIGARTAGRNKLSALMNAEDKEGNLVHNGVSALAEFAGWRPTPAKQGTRMSSEERLVKQLRGMSATELRALLEKADLSEVVGG